MLENSSLDKAPFVVDKVVACVIIGTAPLVPTTWRNRPGAYKSEQQEIPYVSIHP